MHLQTRIRRDLPSGRATMWRPISLCPPTNFPSEVAEMALAHVVSSKVEAAYRRGDLFEKRRGLIEAWANFCAQPKSAGKVVRIA